MNLKRKSLSVFLMVLCLTLLGVITVSAALGLTSYTGPTWTAAGYEFSVQADPTSPHHYVCVFYSIGSALETHNRCTGSGGSYTCVIPGDHPNTTIRYRFAGSSNDSCSGNVVFSSENSFTTGPTAVELASFAGANQPDYGPLLAALVVVILVSMLLVGGLIWHRKARV